MNANVINNLNGILADSIVFYQKLHHFHWRVQGRGFYQLHAKFEELYNHFGALVDEVAERILMVEGQPLASLKQALEISRVEEIQDIPQAEEMVSLVLADLKAFRKRVAEGIAVAEDAGDRGSANMLDPVADNQNVMTAGPHGPQLLQDVWFLEKLAHFDREVIPERRMHAKGSGAYGTFTVTHDITRFTMARIFSEIGKKTDLFSRFSTVAGERGAADAERDIRGFALKFYTEEGNWDLVGNNTPVFFLRDPLKFPDLNHAVKRDPRTNLRSARNNWDFWASLPEALHQITITMSDRGIPLSYRHMHGFGSHTFSLINAQNQRHWVKFHFVSQQGVKNLTDAEAEAMVGKCRESHQRDLYDSIENKNYPKWKLFIQVMTEQEAASCPFNPFDLTKVWFHKDYPLLEVGEIELNRNPENYFAEVEQSAFNPASIVPGIGFSPDKVLQGRLFSYGDAQRYRLGVNHHLIPVNAPRCPVHSYHRDGAMRVDDNHGGTIGYEPNSSGQWQQQAVFSEPPLNLDGAGDHWNHRDDDDYFSQTGLLFRLMSPEQQEVLFANTARSMGGVPEAIKIRHIINCSKADPAYGKGVSEALGISWGEVP